jgi:signal transduction histidine kinase
MNFPFLKHPKSAQSLHVNNLHHYAPEVNNEERSFEKSQEEFLSIASHELRTPLTAIKGNVSIIKQYFWEQIPGGELRGMIDDIDQASSRMIKLINNVLDTLRLEQGLIIFKPQSVDIVALVRQVAAKYQSANQNRELQIILNEPVSTLNNAQVDPLWTKNLLGYILDNAVKYTDRGVINISFFQDPDAVRVAVSDTGPGITPEAQKTMFTKFAQTNKNILTRDTVQGTGLGLYLAKLVSKQMQGDVRLESSEQGRGSTFDIILPVVK